MGQSFLMDTNVIIGYLSKLLPAEASASIDQLPAVISVITRIELLGWYNATPAQLEKLQLFIGNAQVYDLNEEIIVQTITLRQQHKIKLPDAVIAATALVYDHTLLTRNTGDFKNIIGLRMESPWA
ncbi:MAG: type II toxin-antitoxin system VapC family toxin [Bacteroidetes bacterium]|nr:type II toxin-antitoxin system VapC family toxin [Bacteroidota bacterium]